MIRILSGVTDLSRKPVTIFEISLIAGDTADAFLEVRTPVDEFALIRMRAKAGGSASFVPAAPTVIRDPIRVTVDGADAVGSISYR